MFHVLCTESGVATGTDPPPLPPSLPLVALTLTLPLVRLAAEAAALEVGLRASVGRSKNRV